MRSSACWPSCCREVCTPSSRSSDEHRLTRERRDDGDAARSALWTRRSHAAGQPHRGCGGGGRPHPPPRGRRPPAGPRRRPPPPPPLPAAPPPPAAPFFCPVFLGGLSGGGGPPFF